MVFGVSILKGTLYFINIVICSLVTCVFLFVYFKTISRGDPFLKQIYYDSDIIFISTFLY